MLFRSHRIADSSWPIVVAVHSMNCLKEKITHIRVFTGGFTDELIYCHDGLKNLVEGFGLAIGEFWCWVRHNGGKQNETEVRNIASALSTTSSCQSRRVPDRGPRTDRKGVRNADWTAMLQSHNAPNRKLQTVGVTAGTITARAKINDVKTPPVRATPRTDATGVWM